MNAPRRSAHVPASHQSRVLVAALGYHEVTDEPETSGFQRPGARPFTVRRAAFGDHLAAIGRAGIDPEVVSDIELSQPGRHVILTFDDGGKSAMYIGDELSRRGWRGHFFIVTARTGTRTFLDPGEIRHLRSCGHVIGTHSHSHPDIFRDLTVTGMLEQWRVSRDRLSQILGESCKSGSVPGGHISPAVLLSAGAAGLEYLFTCEPTLMPVRVGECWVLGRVLIKSDTSSQRVERLASFQGWDAAMMVRRVKETVRHRLPGLFRYYVERRTIERDRGS